MSASLLLITIGLFLLRPVIDAMARERKSVTLVFGLAGVGVLVAGLIWPFLQSPDPGTFRASIDAASRDFRWWFGVVAAAWLYQVSMNVLNEIRRNNEIVALRNDVQAIANVIERGLMPRHLTKRQQASMISFLRQFEPHNVTLQYLSGDEEAGGFRADIHQALEKGGWTIAKTEPRTDIQDGVRIHVSRTMADQQAANAEKNHRQPDTILRMAFGSAGVMIDGSGSGSGVNVTETVLSIAIGRNRRDSYRVDPPIGMF